MKKFSLNFRDSDIFDAKGIAQVVRAALYLN